MTNTVEGTVLPRILRAVALCLLVPLGVSAPRCAAQGSITTFDAPGAGTAAGQGTFPVAISPTGVITGLYTDASNVNHCFVRTPDRIMTTFDAPGAGTGANQGTIPLSINLGGAIAGLYIDTNSVQHGFMRSPDGTFVTFDAPGAGTGAGQGTLARNINVAGVIAGYLIDGGNVFHGFVRTFDGTFTIFDAPGAGTGANQGTRVAAVSALTDEGAIGGNYIDANKVSHGYFRAPGGTITTFDGPGAGTAAGQGTFLGSINSAGVDGGEVIDINGVLHGILRAADGTFTTFDVPGAGTGLRQGTVVENINAISAATGEFIDANNVRHGFVRAPDGTIATFDVPGAGTSAGQGTFIGSNNLAGELTGWSVDASGAAHGFAAATPGLSFSLSGDWSNTTNPNGPWSYNQGSTPLPLVANWTANNSAFVGCNQPAWAPSNSGGNFLPALMNANSCTANDLGTDPVNDLANVAPADIVTHTVDPFNGNPANGVANFLFTLPAGDDGQYEIRGFVWDASLFFGTSRPQDWHLLINGVQVASGVLSGVVSHSEAQAFDFLEDLTAGDTVELQLLKDPSTGAGFFVGTNMSVVAVSAVALPQTVLKITAPPSVRLDALESNQNAFSFAERVSFVLPSDIAVDATSPGTYNSDGSLTPGIIPAGTVVDSYFLHADPFDPNNGVFYSGSVSFSNPILGVIALSASLDQTDATLGAPGTLYPVPGSEPARGFELGFPDMFVISADRKTLTFSDAVFGASDQLRIVTAASPAQPVAPGTSTTFTSPNVINQTVTIPPDANMNGAVMMRVSFIQVSPAVFNASIAGGTNGNDFSGGKPVPAGTTCTPIAGAGGNCIITENKCFDVNGVAFALCPITATTTPIQLTSQYETSSPQPNPALMIASDGQTNYAVITTGFNSSDPTISGGTKALNSDEVIANLPGLPPADTVPPATTASTSPLAPNGANGWFTTSPVSVILTATDDTLVKQISYSATGAQPIAPTTVAGASTLFQIASQGVTTISFQATDQAGNVESPKTLTVKIDTTAPSISISTPANGAAYMLNQAVAASYTCSDPESSPAPSCNGPVANGSNIDAASVGSKSFTVNSTDAAGLSSTQTDGYTVSYKVCILYNPALGVKSGTVIPLKMYLCDAKGNDVSNSSVIVHATKLIQVSTQAPETISTALIATAGNANPGNNFRFDSTLGPSGGYIFNLLANLPTGTYELFFTAGNDPSTTHFLTFQVK